MRLLLLGGSGLLGSSLLEEAGKRGLKTCAPTREELNITRPDHVGKIPTGELGEFDWAINCAAYTAVDRAEAEPDEARLVNSYGPAILAHACGMADLRLLHVSTDFVFDGELDRPYTEEDRPNPLGEYGASKLEGEQRALESLPNAVITRSSWLFGPGGPCFPLSILKAAQQSGPLRVVADQRGTPTYTPDLAKALLDLLALEPEGGIYNAAGQDAVTWHEFAERALVAFMPEPPAIEPITTADWPTAATRPANSALDTSKLSALGIRPWRPLSEALADLSRRLSSSGPESHLP